MSTRKAWLSILVFGLLWVSSARAAVDQFFDSDGVKIRYQVQGEGEPVLLIHGYVANIELQWGEIPAMLATNHKVIAYDNRGHGKSDKPHDASKYGVEMVKDAIRLLDHLKIKKAHIVGYSMGGFITNKLLTMYPDRVITATLGGAGWRREGDPAGDVVDQLADALDKNGDISPLIIALTPAGRPVPTAEQLKAMNQAVIGTNDVKALAACARGLKGLMVTEEQLRANELKVLALIGDQDPLKPGVDAMNGVMPNLTIVPIAGADHMTAFTSDVFKIALIRFIDSRGADAEPARPVLTLSVDN